MIFYMVKVLLTAVIIVAASEVSARSNVVAALLVSIPTVSVLSIIWIYIERGDIANIISLSNGIFWLVIPSLVFFVALPILLKNGVSFTLSMLISMGLTALSYAAMLWLLKQFGISV